MPSLGMPALPAAPPAAAAPQEPRGFLARRRAEKDARKARRDRRAEAAARSDIGAREVLRVGTTRTTGGAVSTREIRGRSFRSRLDSH